MASTSSLHNPLSHYLLRLNRLIPKSLEIEDSQLFELTPRRTISPSLDLCEYGTIDERFSYSIDLLSADNLGVIECEISFMGSEQDNLRTTTQPANPERIGDIDYHLYSLDLGENSKRPFLRTYGMVRICLEISPEAPDSNPLLLSTRDIPCACHYENQEKAVSGMLEELLSADDNTALRWMLSFPSQNSGMLMPGDVFDSSQSLKAYLGLAEAIITYYENSLSYFRIHGHGRTAPRKKRVGMHSVRTLGRQELMWIATNPERLYRALPGTGIDIYGDTFAIREILTDVQEKSFDNPENRSVVAFISDIAKSLSSVIPKAEKEIERLSAIKSNLSARVDSTRVFPTLILVDAFLGREQPLVGKAVALRHRALRMKRLYEEALPCRHLTVFSLPKRTKVFQEVHRYSDIYLLMSKWVRFGNFNFKREGLLVNTLRMDKLYEYYVLYKLLDWFADAGFSPDDSVETPISSIDYSENDAYFSNETQVANSYQLRRDEERIRLYYQPVFYGQDIEEGGIHIHRTTRSHPLHENRDSYLLPDYLLVHQLGNKETSIVLDAKFRSSNDLITHEGDREANVSPFEKCLLKYKCSVAKDDGSPVDAVWLLSGVVSPSRIAGRTDMFTLQSSGWASRFYRGIADGIATLTPNVNTLERALGLMGISRSPMAAPDSSASSDEEETVSETPAQQIDTTLTDVVGAPETGRTDSNAAGRIPLVEEDAEEKPEKQAQRKDVRPGQLDDNILEMITIVCDHSFKDSLFSQRNCQSEFGFNHPLLRKKRPVGHEAKLYSSTQYHLAGGEYYVYLKWIPTYKKRLESIVRRIEASSKK